MPLTDNGNFNRQTCTTIEKRKTGPNLKRIKRTSSTSEQTTSKNRKRSIDKSEEKMNCNEPPILRVLKDSVNHPIDDLPALIVELIVICASIQKKIIFFTGVELAEQKVQTTIFRSDQGRNFPAIQNFPIPNEYLDNPEKIQSYISAQESEKYVPANLAETKGFYPLTIKVYLSALSERIQSVLDLSKTDASDVELPSPSDLTSLMRLQKELLELLDELDLKILDYTSKTVQSLEIDKRWHSLTQRKEKIEKIVKMLSQKTVDDHLKFFKMLEFSDYLGEVIGLKNSVIHTILDDQSDFVLKHCSIEELIHTYFDDVNEASDNNEKQLPYDAQFEELGFSKSVATYLASQMVHDSGKNLFTVLELAHAFLEDVFVSNLMLAGEPKQIPQHPQQLKDTDYKLNNEAVTNETKLINCMDTKKIPKGDKSKNVVTNDIKEKLKGNPENGFEFLYHATSSAHADNIRKYGINPKKGKPSKDFSYNNGFYLSDTVEAALEYTKSRPGAAATAVMRYKIPSTLFSSLKRGLLEFQHYDRNHEKQWRHVVRYFRSGMSEDPTKIKNKLDKVQCIKGPVSDAAQWKSEYKNKPHWPGYYNDSWIQVCICNDDLAKTANQHLDFILNIQN